MDGYSGYPSDQCLTEILDYWLRHHSDLLTWTEVSQALKVIELNQLAAKALQISSNPQSSMLHPITHSWLAGYVCNVNSRSII